MGGRGGTYHNLIFNPSAFYQLPSHIAANIYNLITPINILSWNVKGAGNTDFRRVFRDLTNSHNPYLVILTETSLSGDRASSGISNLCFEGFLKVDAMGFSGGI